MIINALHRNNASHRNNRMIIMLRKIKILFIYHLILPLIGAKLECFRKHTTGSGFHT